MTESIQDTDIAIVGGGMAGASLALLLAHHCPQLNVALLERQSVSAVETPLTLPSFDTRATAIAAGSLSIFSQLGLWPALQEFAEPIRQVQVSDRGHSLGASLDARREKAASFDGMLGAVIENAALGPLLYRALEKTSVQLLDNAQVTDVEMLSSGAKLHIQRADNISSLQTRLLVIADGAGSALCNRLGILTSKVDYQQQALVTTVGLQRDHRGIAFERFTDTGPMALLPLPKRHGVHRAALVWTCEESAQPSLADLPERDFIRHLQQTFGWRAGRIIRAGKVHSYPLTLSLAREQVRRGVVLVGNSAHFLHPVAGQGFNLTLRDCDGLARTIGRTVAEKGPDFVRTGPGELDLLEAYWRERQHDQQLTIGFSDKIPPLFASRNLLTSGLRQLGLLGLALTPATRTAFARQAAGITA
ncbi:FAD-dependent monooxygenase [Microbulbifer sp. HZ11]|uniref:FAD-dependent monooxygenase n=1 Tax=Microbulbifer sp. HZ11 TaxID=1453501 RepID=UPI0005BCC9A9|nr:FAD-dependent monooxygenase [Microbulbifer sp. HZ11]